MDRVLAAIVGSNSCNELLKSFESILHSSRPPQNADVKPSLDELFDYFFLEYRHEEKRGARSSLWLPDSVLVALAIASILLGDVYIHRFALRLSRIRLSAVLSTLDDESIARYGGALGVEIEFSKEKCFKEILTNISVKDVIMSTCYRYRIPVNVYLRVARRLLTEHPWQLSSLILDRGYVYIDDRDKILRLLSEHVYSIVVQGLKRISNNCSNRDAVRNRLIATLSEFDQEMARAFDDNLKRVSQLVQQAPISIMANSKSLKSVGQHVRISNLDELIAVSQTMFPPCIRELVNAVMKGENLSHHQRFALATYLINLDVDLELIVKLFSFSPDFNEKITRYQVEHLAGLRGSRKKYLVYSCNTMKTLGLCKSECGVKNPLLYLRRVGAKAEAEGQEYHKAGQQP